jgi:acetyl-CoA carboxylase biotin carboxylase subunit
LIKKVLIANRGEIALRIIRACKELGIPTVAVYSSADSLSLHVRFADEAVCIGPANSQSSYLKQSQIISAAEVTNADAIHPGYGFLAENPDFAQMCEDNEILFIGPKAEVIRQMGDKAAARAAMIRAGVPVIPGSQDIISDFKNARKVAEQLGYPVILKAAAGGGGRGMRIVREPDQLEQAYGMAREEARAAFDNPNMYLEKLLEKARHIEVQILGDNYGNIVYLGERECSIQRRHQKLIEESPSPVVDEVLREKLGKIAVKAAKVVAYSSAGTVEFLLDTRIQVEHPVTEMVTGCDLLKEQICLADGAQLPRWVKKFKLRGHAIECRINAEDPYKNFRPSPGKIQAFHAPGGPGTRMDTHVYSGYEIPSNYDSLLGKLITHGKDRAEAIARMRRALEETIIEGIPTSIPFHQAIINSPEFQQGNFHIDFLKDFKFG